MNKLYTWNTPNGQKPVIALEEMAISYELVPVDITNEAQFDPAFIRINPNGKIPAYVENELAIFESGAILQYLAETRGAFLPESGPERVQTLSWCYWQVGGLGPMIGQWGHFAWADEKIPYAINRYLDESLRLYKVLDTRLNDARFLAGDTYTIADMMSYPWAKGGLNYLKQSIGDDLPDLPGVSRWIEEIDGRPAVARAMDRIETAVKLPQG
ncbi:MAG: glutathione S-transferase N-terminal domain-containing protein [Pseudomonadota bacterium]